MCDAMSCRPASDVPFACMCVNVYEWVGVFACVCADMEAVLGSWVPVTHCRHTHTPTQETIKKTPCLRRCAIRPSPLAPSLVLDASVRQRRLKLWGGGETVAPRNAAHEHGAPMATLHYYVRRDSKWWPRALSPPRAATQMSK